MYHSTCIHQLCFFSVVLALKHLHYSMYFIARCHIKEQGLIMCVAASISTTKDKLNLNLNLKLFQIQVQIQIQIQMKFQIQCQPHDH